MLRDIYQQLLAKRAPLDLIEESVYRYLVGDKTFPVDFDGNRDTPWLVESLRFMFRYVGYFSQDGEMEVYIVDRVVLSGADLAQLETAPQNVCDKLLRKCRFTCDDLLTQMVRSESERLRATANWIVKSCQLAGQAVPMVESFDAADRECHMAPLTNHSVQYTREQMIFGVVVDLGHLGRYRLQWRDQKNILFGDVGEGLWYSKVSDDTELTPADRGFLKPFTVGGKICSRVVSGVNSVGTGKVYPLMQYMRDDDFYETYFVSEQGVVFKEVSK